MESLTGGDSLLPEGQPVFDCYNRLKREIEALIRENKELKRLVDLIRENQGLRTVIRSQTAGSETQPPSRAPSRSSERGHSNVVVSPGPTAESSGPAAENDALVWTDNIEAGTVSRAHIPSASQGSQALLSEGLISGARAQSLDAPRDFVRDSSDSSKRYRYIRVPSSFHSRGPTAESSGPAAENDALVWTDTIEEGSVSRAPIPSAFQGSQALLSEGLISGARAQSLDAPRDFVRDSSDSSKRYRYIRVPSSFHSRDSVFGPTTSGAPSPWDSNLSDDVFTNDVQPQRLSSPLARSTPISFRLPAPPEAQRPPDVRPKEMTRKPKALTQGATSKANVVKDHRQQTWERIVGEIAFQLDRRILCSIFPERVRLYGFTVNNIPGKIAQVATDPTTNQVDEQQCTMMTRRFLEIMNRLKAFGYDPVKHPHFTEHIVNTYGILRERPDLPVSEITPYNNVEFLRKVVVETVPPNMRNNTLLLLECLFHLSRDDGKPMFIW